MAKIKGGKWGIGIGRKGEKVGSWFRDRVRGSRQTPNVESF